MHLYAGATDPHLAPPLLFNWLDDPPTTMGLDHHQPWPQQPTNMGVRGSYLSTTKMVNFGPCYLEEQVRCEGRRSRVSETSRCTAVHMATPPTLEARAWL